MKEAPIYLLNYFATDVALATNHAFTTDKPIEFKETEFIVDVAVKRNDASAMGERHWQVVLDVRHQPGTETNFPYSYRVVLVGQFSVVHRVKSEDEERLIRIQGASVLYGMTREIVRELTGRGPYRPIILPTVSFYEQKSGHPGETPPTGNTAETAASAEKPKARRGKIRATKR